MKKLILIVCNGNIHRSVIAEQCINRALRQNGLELRYTAVSRGLQGTGGTESPGNKNLRDYPLEWSLTKPILDELGITLPSDKVATPITVRIVEEAILILAMDRSVLLTRSNSLVQQFPLSGFKMRLFCELDGRTNDVPDCFGWHEVDRYRRVISEIHTIASGRIQLLLALAEILTIQKERKSE